jgi:hypothetical protein
MGLQCNIIKTTAGYFMGLNALGEGTFAVSKQWISA